MTKREICERLISICEKMALIFNDTDDQRAVWAGEEAREILLDLAAPDDHFADAGKMMSENEDHFADLGKKGAPLPDISVAAPEEEKPDVEQKKEPPVLIYEENGEKVPCPVCGEPAYQFKNKPGAVYCKRCGLCPRRPK